MAQQMRPTLDIVTITKDDADGVAATVLSTRALRACDGVKQIVIDSSAELVSAMVRERLAGERGASLYQQAPCGIASAFNLGITHATADWLWFLNGRDVVHPDLDATFLLQLLRSSHADVLIFQLEFMQSRTVMKHPPLWALWPPMNDNWVPHPATFIRTAVFERFGVFSGKYRIAMDSDLWLRVFGSDVVVDMLSIPVVVYDENGVSATDRTQTSIEVGRIVRRNIGMLTRMWLVRGVHLLRTYLKS